MTNPAYLAVDALQGLEKPLAKLGLYELNLPLYQRARKASLYLTQVESCISRLEYAGKDLAGIRGAMPRLWSCASGSVSTGQASVEIELLKMFGHVIDEAKIVPSFTPDALGRIRQSLEDLHEFINGEPDISSDLRKELLFFVADAIKLCDDSDLFDPMTFNEAVNDVVVSGLRYGSRFTKEEIKDPNSRGGQFLGLLGALARDVGVSLVAAGAIETGAQVVKSITS